MDKFRVALSSDFNKPDGTPAFPMFDVGPLRDDPGIDLRYVAAEDGVIPAAGLADTDALILLVPKFGRSSVPPDGRLAMVARFGVGYDNVDLDACNEAEIAAVITPDGVRRPVAVSILTFVLALSQRMLIKDRLCRQGPEGWNQRAEHMGDGLIGKTIGQLGMGNIGAEVFRLAAPFGLRFMAHDPYADPEVAGSLGVELVSMERLFRDADFLSVSVPLSESTHHVVNAERLALMKPTAFVINTARGPVVDQRALYDALASGRLAGAGLDVFEVEPAPADEPILALENVIVAPHALCWTDECFAGNGAADVAAVQALRRGEVPRGIINRGIIDHAAFKAKLQACARRFGAARS
ncbi:MAG: NAD(P)-dependent oxidoreductase [Pseudomonadota bacterium]